jgi:hypothetical protein
LLEQLVLDIVGLRTWAGEQPVDAALQVQPKPLRLPGRSGSCRCRSDDRCHCPSFDVRYLRPLKRGGEVPDSVNILPASRLPVRLHRPSGLTARRKPVSYGCT